MQFKLILKDEAKLTQQKVTEFCQPQNISQLLQHLVIDDGVFADMETKVKVLELIRCMIGIMSDYLIQQTTQIVIKKGDS